MLRISGFIAVETDCENISHCAVFLLKQMLNIHVMLMAAQTVTVVAKVIHASFLKAGS
jgi:hypothetical protein